MSRIDTLVSLALLCKCIVIQINKSELSSKFTKNCDKGDKFNNFSIKDLISRKKGFAKETIEFYDKIERVWEWFASCFLLLFFFVVFFL